ncbi:MAG: KpsF/GutQ family sugar-phosphate isomerase [Bacteroidota bacterium]
MKLEKNIQLSAKNVLKQEAEAIINIINLIDNSFETCVRHILSLKGRLVVTGIGKSAIIAQKLVATLNSTGTPSLFMHAADAIHGDLGMIQPDDSVLVISKSGDTPELKVLVPLIKRAGQKLICMVSNTHSFLAKQSDFILPATIETEACPLNLAPTTSTTVSLALGDALAICLLEQRDFTSADFGKYHPGGALGKKLYLKVNDIFPNNSFPVVQKKSSIKDVIIEISAKRLGITVVMDENENMAGVITDGDIRRMLDKYDDLKGLAAEDIMNQNPKTIEYDEYAINALNYIQDKNITQLVAMKKDKPVGIVHLHDLLKEGLI